MIQSVLPDPTPAAFSLMEKGEVQQAEEIFRKILATEAYQPDALHGLGCLARMRGQNGLAIGLLGKALQNQGVPSVRRARMHITLGLALLGEGHAEPARAALSVARALQPEDPRAHVALADALIALGRRDDAVFALHAAKRVALDDALIRTRLGQMAFERGKLDEAAAEFRHVVAKLPFDGAAHANLGAVLFTANALDEARDVLLQAVACGAVSPQTFNNLGLVQMALGDLPSARVSLERAHDDASDDLRIAGNLGTVLSELGETEAASSIFERIAIASPESAEGAMAVFNRSSIMLGRGQFYEGWKAFEARRNLIAPGRSASAIWDGSAGNSPITIVAEQGLGDMVQFLRFLPLAAQRRPLRIRFPEGTQDLVSRVIELDVSCLQPWNGSADAEISLLSLPFVMGLNEAPAKAPYLRVSTLPEPDLVGLTWSGNPTYRFDRRRSVGVKLLEILKDIPGLRFLGLQRGDIPDWMEKPSDIETVGGLADAVGRCALVISVDTLVAHLAGAVGRPLWLLNRFGGDWRWKDVSWYENVLQFRPKAPSPPAESWPDVIEELAVALRRWSEQGSGSGL
ncbi:tetratricopeptide repeat protein [Gluconobacter wancherniae]|uniref:tetratricopeptide repeat protein n=1 Tax=Gluconobacter wancherniae TaxID=1307955 RepID=UPI002011783A|nr:tetratricopeptide repeat protein [Gluconobacter wancherniae]